MAWNSRDFAWGGIHYCRPSEPIRKQNCYLPFHISLPILFVTFASILDGLCTLWYVHAGGYEVNPLMALALQGGGGIFMFVKMLLTGYGSYLLARYWQSPLAMRCLHCLSVGYTGLLLVHGFLLLQ